MTWTWFPGVVRRNLDEWLNWKVVRSLRFALGNTRVCLFSRLGLCRQGKIVTLGYASESSSCFHTCTKEDCTKERLKWGGVAFTGPWSCRPSFHFPYWYMYERKIEEGWSTVHEWWMYTVHVPGVHVRLQQKCSRTHKFKNYIFKPKYHTILSKISNSHKNCSHC